MQLSLRWIWLRSSLVWLGMLGCLTVLADVPSLAGYPPYQDTNESYVEEDEQTANDYYSAYYESAMTASRNGETTKAIDLMLKAYKLAPNNTALLNNLSMFYTQRGVYFHNTKKDYQKALDDYRQALFYLVYEWPTGVAKSGGAEQNTRIIEDNIENVLKSLKAPANDWKWHLKQAWDLRRKGRLPEAMAAYAQVAKLNPKHAESWTAMGDIYTIRQKPDKAVVAYQKAADTSNASSDTLFVKLGTALLQTGNMEKSVEAFNKALALNAKNRDALLALEQVWKKEIVLNPRNMSAHLNLGAVYQQLGRYDEAYAQYQVADRLSPNNPLIWLNMGSLHQAKGQLDEALRQYDAVLRQNPGNAQVLLYKADVLKQQGKAQEAEQMLQQALQAGGTNKKAVLDQLLAVYKAQGDPAKIKSGWELYARTFPQDAAVQYQAGLALHEAKDFEGAITYYQSAVVLNPKMAEAYANLGTAYHALNRDEEAVKALKTALQLDPSLEEVKSLAAAIEQQKGSKVLLEAAQLHEQGDYAKAIQGYQESLKREPKNADLYARLGLAQQALRRYTEAIASYDKAIALVPEQALYHYYKGSVYDEQNQLAPAQRLYEKALSLDPNLAQAQQALDALKTDGAETQLAKALDAYNQKRYVNSLQILEEVLKLDPQNATAYYYKGLVHDAQKKLDPARLSYEKAVQLNSGLADAVYALAVVLDTQGKRADAKKVYQQFIDLTREQPEDDFIKYAKERVSSL